MPGREPDNWGIPPWEAIERWTPRELSGRYRELAEYDIPMVILDGRHDPGDEARTLRSRITKILVDKLVRGELIASAIALPLKETSRRRDIRPELWARLTFGHRFLMVVGNGLKYGEVLIREASRSTRSSAEQMQQAGPPSAQPHHPTRGPGRPSIMPAIEAQMRRRADKGQLEKSLRREAEVLATWALQQFLDAHVPAPKSIAKRLRPIYRELKAEKKTDKSADKL